MHGNTSCGGIFAAEYWRVLPGAGIGEGRKRMRIREFLLEEDGVGVIEVVLILVVLIGLVIVFKDSINSLLTDIFKEINSLSEDVY